LRLAVPATEDAILELAATRSRQDDDPELDTIAARRVTNLVERGELAAARQQLHAAGGVLGDAERRRLYTRIAEMPRSIARGPTASRSSNGAPARTNGVARSCAPDSSTAASSLPAARRTRNGSNTSVT
jgi:hypothetical protein